MAMAVRLSHSQLPDLLTWLTTYQPESFKIYDDLQSHLRGEYPDLLFYVDRWPDPQALSVVIDPDGELLEGKAYVGNDNYGVFCSNEEALITLMGDKRVFDSNKTAKFCAIPKSHWPLMRSVIEEKMGPVEPEICFLLEVNQDTLKRIPVPKGLKISPVTDETIDMVNSTWNYSGKGSDLFIRDLIRHNPSVLLTTNEGEHVGHVIGQSYSTIGMLYIRPRFRGKGYSKVITSELIAKMFEQGRTTVYSMVVEGNESSLRLHQSLGFRVVPCFHYVYIYLKCAPKALL